MDWKHIWKRIKAWWNYCPVCADLGFCNQHPRDE